MDFVLPTHFEDFWFRPGSRGARPRTHNRRSWPPRRLGQNADRGQRIGCGLWQNKKSSISPYLMNSKNIQYLYKKYLCATWKNINKIFESCWTRKNTSRQMLRTQAASWYRTTSATHAPGSSFCRMAWARAMSAPGHFSSEARGRKSNSKLNPNSRDVFFNFAF